VAAARRLDEGAADLMRAPLLAVDLGAMARAMAAAFDRPDGVRVTAEIVGGQPVLATEDCLETVIENLLDNAIGFSPQGGSVRIRVAAEGAMVALAVEDDGPGVPPDRLEAIFRRHVSSRAADDGSRSHFGVGLAVVRRTVEVLGGTVTAENVPGLRVTVRLPAAG
jgi:two-component system sensor histidine kinase ChvG